MLRGGGGTRTQGLDQAPVLEFHGEIPGFTWTNGGPTPDHWQFQVSADGVSGWSNAWTAPGGDAEFDWEPDNQFYRLAGFTAGNVQSSEWSDPIQATI
jgi:hypothetical protein